MAVYTKLNTKDVLNIIETYDLGNLTQFQGIKEGIENTNYLIHTTQGKYVLTIFEKRVLIKDIPFFVNIMKHLKKNHFISPEPLQDRKGIIIKSFKNKKFILVSFLEGYSKLNLSDNDCFEIGKVIGDMHTILKDFKLEKKNNLSVNSWEQILLKCKKSISNFELNQLNSKLLDLINEILVECKLYWPYHLPKGIIHGDLFPDNLFFKNNKVNGVIDFYFSCTDIKFYEIAIAINALCFDKDCNLNINKTKNLIFGYNSKFKIDPEEINNINILLKGACLRFLLTRLYDWFKTPNNSFVKKKDPKEYIKKLIYFKKNNLNFLNDFIKNK